MPIPPPIESRQSPTTFRAIRRPRFGALAHESRPHRTMAPGGAYHHPTSSLLRGDARRGVGFPRRNGSGRSSAPLKERERMVAAIRPTPEQFAAADWAAILPHYDALASCPLDADNAEA